MIIAAVDPGQRGGIAFLDTATGKLLTYSTPGFDVKDAKGKKTGRKIFDPFSASALLVSHKPDVFIIERVHARTGQGVTSMFNFGMDFGTWIGIAVANNLKPVYYYPQTWKGALGLNKSKELSLKVAREKFPENVADFKRKLDDGRAEAALLAHYHTIVLNSASSQKQKLLDEK
ncbi:hypothetical protein [Roseibium aggregatum]|uniref:Uncharacterized protein n=1 Tax=Roseibium aggregatum TaxID=187304 RepID=A0A0M6Y7N1_9HYPH|nr:hypothetical protein [Roseibium aggregatum]CTQ45678.1 hypothetical protein LAL4801_04133 [Roseibium aggregatum]